MHSYEGMRLKHSKKVCQTVDSPIMVFDYFELKEMMISIFVMLLFGIIINSWKLMFLSLFVTLGLLPVIRRRNQKGILLHFPYRRFGMSLPGLVNPGKGRRYSD